MFLFPMDGWNTTFLLGRTFRDETLSALTALGIPPVRITWHQTIHTPDIINGWKYLRIWPVNQRNSGKSIWTKAHHEIRFQLLIFGGGSSQDLDTCLICPWWSLLFVPYGSGCGTPSTLGWSSKPLGWGPLNNQPNIRIYTPYIKWVCIGAHIPF